MRKLAIGMLGLVALYSATAGAQGFQYSDQNRRGRFAADGAIGFTISPDLFLTALEGAYYVHHNVSLGPLLQMGLDNDIFLLSPSFNVRGVFDLPISGFGRRVKPFVQGGVGFSYINIDTGAGSGDDTSFLINFGFGVDIHLTTNFALGNNMLFNIVPTMGDNFYFAWQFLSARYYF